MDKTSTYSDQKPLKTSKFLTFSVVNITAGKKTPESTFVKGVGWEGSSKFFCRGYPQTKT